MFAVLGRCRSIPQIIDRVAGHTGSLFRAPAGSRVFRSDCGESQTTFREAKNGLGAAGRFVLTADPAVNSPEQVARYPDRYLGLTSLRRRRLTRRHALLRASGFAQNIPSTHEKSPATCRAFPRRTRELLKDLKTFSEVPIKDRYARLKHKPRATYLSSRSWTLRRNARMVHWTETPTQSGRPFNPTSSSIGALPGIR